MLNDADMTRLLRETQVIAVVGLSNETWRPSYSIARYLQSKRYRIVPANPGVIEVLGEPAFPDLLAVPFAIDLVNIFRRSEFVAPHVDEAIYKGVKGIWMQPGAHDEQAAQKARDQGIQVVVNRCIAVEHRRLLG